MRPEPIGRDTNKIPVLQTEIPEFEEEPKYRRPKEKDYKFAWPSQDQAVIPAPPQEAVEKQNESIPGEWIGVGVKGRDLMRSAPKGQNDCHHAENHHQYANESDHVKSLVVPDLKHCFFGQKSVIRHGV